MHWISPTPKFALSSPSAIDHHLTQNEILLGEI